MILSNVPGSFPWGVLEKRHPALIGQVRDAHPYTPAQRRGLDALLEEITLGTIRPLPESAHDSGQWAAWGRDHIGRRWTDVPFLWAESFFYRKLLQAVGYFEPGPWQGVDPFAPVKQAELDSDGVAGELAALDRLDSLPPDVTGQALLHASLWGNRADLSFRLTAEDPSPARSGRLVADDSAALWSLLGRTAPATLAVFADNAGGELLPDLVLIDHLLRRGLAGRVVLHVKPYPYYISDATLADVLACLRRLLRATGPAGAIGRRLWNDMGAGRLDIRAHGFFCAPLPFREMPEDLRQDVAACDLALLKGDLNYRRLVEDRLWPATSSFTDRTAWFPTAVAALRTVKSDVITGLSPATVSRLESGGRPWRTTGTHALIQLRP
nr:damage-control phosphatase ARMT1 family protein [Streptomyces sp. YIM 98790]